MPPLCQRKDDILPLARHFVSKCAIRLGLPIFGSTPRVWTACWIFLARKRAGVGECHRACRDLLPRSVILPRYFPLQILSRGRLQDEQESVDRPHRSLAEVEWEYIQRVLAATDGTAGQRQEFSALAKPRSIGVWAIRSVTGNLRRH